MERHESSKQYELSTKTEKVLSQEQSPSNENFPQQPDLSNSIMKQYWAIFIVVFFVSSTPIALSSIVWEAYKILFPDATFTSATFIVDEWVIVGIVAIDTFVLLLLIPTLRPFKELLITKYIKKETPRIELEKEAYRKFVRLPYVLLSSFPIAITTLEYTTIRNAGTGIYSTGPILISLFYLLMIYIIVYLLGLAYVNKFLHFFHYDSTIQSTKASRRVLISLILGFAIFGQMITSIYTFLPDNLILEGIGIFWMLGFPAIIFLPIFTVITTVKPVERLLKLVKTLDPNETKEIPVPNMNSDENGELTAILVGLVNQSRQQLEQNKAIAQELISIAQELSTGTEEITAAAENISNAQNQISKGAGNQVQSIQATQREFLQLADGVKSIAEKVNEVQSIADSIGSIANQTNILALNAAIEAARAGEAGRGFNVVADQVRKLADESKRAIQRTNYVVEDIRKETKLDQERAQLMIGSVQNIASVAEETAASTEEISSSAEQQSASMETMASQAQTLLNLAKKLENRY